MVVEVLPKAVHHFSKGDVLATIDGVPCAGMEPQRAANLLNACVQRHGRWIVGVVPSRPLPPPGFLAYVRLPVRLTGPLPSITSLRDTGCYSDADRVLELNYM